MSEEISELEEEFGVGGIVLIPGPVLLRGHKSGRVLFGQFVLVDALLRQGLADLDFHRTARALDMRDLGRGSVARDLGRLHLRLPGESCRSVIARHLVGDRLGVSCHGQRSLSVEVESDPFKRGGLVLFIAVFSKVCAEEQAQSEHASEKEKGFTGGHWAQAGGRGRRTTRRVERSANLPSSASRASFPSASSPPVNKKTRWSPHWELHRVRATTRSIWSAPCGPYF